MKILDIKLGTERVCHITKQMMHSFSVIISISQSKEDGKDQDRYNQVSHLTKDTIWESDEITTLESYVRLGFASVNITVLMFTNPDVNLKRTHLLYGIPYTNTYTEIKLVIRSTTKWVYYPLHYLFKHLNCS